MLIKKQKTHNRFTDSSTKRKSIQSRILNCFQGTISNPELNSKQIKSTRTESLNFQSSYVNNMKWRIIATDKMQQNNLILPINNTKIDLNIHKKRSLLQSDLKSNIY